MARTKDLVLTGMALKGIVRAAETPVSGELVKRQLFADLGLDRVFELDLSKHGNPEPASLPLHPEGEEH